MKKIFLLLCIVHCALCNEINAQQRLTFEEYDFCAGGLFQSVSNNGKYVAGYSSSSYGGANTGFIYIVEIDSLICLNPEYEDNPDFAHLVSASALDVSDNGIVVGSYTFDDATLFESRPGYYNIKTGLWTKLELPEEIEGKITYENAHYGEATSISADGKYIGGYFQMKMDNSTRKTLVAREVACIWVRTNEDAENPIYELQKPIDTDHTKILSYGDRAYRMSDDGKWLGGHGTNNFGCFNVLIWENHFNGSLLDKTILKGKEDVDRDGDWNGDGVMNDDDGAVDGQYWWGGTVNNISPSGEWICGEHSYNGTGYADSELPAVGFRYNTITKVLEDTLFGGIPFVIFDDGEMIYRDKGVTSSSIDKSVQCGTYTLDAGFGIMNFPIIILNNEDDITDIESIEKLDVELFINNSTLLIEGEFTSVEIFSIDGTFIGIYSNNEISLSNMNKGIYLIRISNGKNIITKKINI